MKLYVKRDKYRVFEKAKIEISKSEDWSTITLALMWAADKEKETIAQLESIRWDTEEEKNKHISNVTDRLERFQKAYELLNNAIEW